MATVQDLEATLLELHTLGLIEFRNDTDFSLTEKGTAKANEAMQKLPMTERVLVMLSCAELGSKAFLEEKDDNAQG